MCPDYFCKNVMEALRPQRQFSPGSRQGQAHCSSGRTPSSQAEKPDRRAPISTGTQPLMRVQNRFSFARSCIRLATWREFRKILTSRATGPWQTARVALKLSSFRSCRRHFRKPRVQSSGEGRNPPPPRRIGRARKLLSGKPRTIWRRLGSRFAPTRNERKTSTNGVRHENAFCAAGG